jgi:hypothetical protein
VLLQLPGASHRPHHGHNVTAPFFNHACFL